jgi:quercetin 2,3-dioxygenase
VLEGSLVHQDSMGHNGVIHPGLAQRMSAGTGILHSERNDSLWSRTTSEADVPVRFVQMWVVPDEPGLEPGYQQREVDAELATGELVPIASGLPRHHHTAAITINNRFAALHVARLSDGDTVELPEAPYLHLFVARGEVALEDTGPLAEGDAARLTRCAPLRVTAAGVGEILVWEMHARLGG